MSALLLQAALALNGKMVVALRIIIAWESNNIEHQQAFL